MAILDFESLKHKGAAGVIAELKRSPKGRERSHRIRLEYEFMYNGIPEYIVKDYQTELFRGEDFEVAVNFYNDLYLKYAG